MDNPYPLNIVYLLYIVGEYVSGFDSVIQQVDKRYRFLVVHFSTPWKKQKLLCLQYIMVYNKIQ